MKIEAKTLTEAIASLECEAQELINYPVDLSERAHEVADGSEDVIYYHKAHAIVRDSTSDELCDAESMVEDCGSEDNTYDGMATMLAFWIVYGRFTERTTEELEAFGEWLEENEPEHPRGSPFKYQQDKLAEHDKAGEALDTILNR